MEYFIFIFLVLAATAAVAWLFAGIRSRLAWRRMEQMAREMIREDESPETAEQETPQFEEPELPPQAAPAPDPLAEKVAELLSVAPEIPPGSTTVTAVTPVVSVMQEKQIEELLVELDRLRAERDGLLKRTAILEAPEIEEDDEPQREPFPEDIAEAMLDLTERQFMMMARPPEDPAFVDLDRARINALSQKAQMSIAREIVRVRKQVREEVQAEAELLLEGLADQLEAVQLGLVRLPKRRR